MGEGPASRRPGVLGGEAVRISDRHLVQYVGGEGVVLVDEMSGEEFMIPQRDLPLFKKAIDYFHDATVEVKP